MTDIKRQIIGMGDGGINEKYPYLDLYILQQSLSDNPRVCLLPTASADNKGLIQHFQQTFGRYQCEPDFLTLFNPHTKDIEDFLMSQDIIYVGGGQTKSMLGIWREWRVDEILKKAYQNGTILAGGSAGSVCWFDECITDSIPGELSVMNGIGILPYSNCPHFRSKERKIAYYRFRSLDQIKDGYAADDYSGLHFINEKWHQSISLAPELKTYFYGKENGIVKKKSLPTKVITYESL
jgi:peptidase E